MEILIAILMYLGFSYSPDQVSTLQTQNNEEVQEAMRIRDNNLYTSRLVDGIVIIDGVNP